MFVVSCRAVSTVSVSESQLKKSIPPTLIYIYNLLIIN